MTLGLILALRALATRLGLPPLAVTLAGFSLFFTDFSFVFAGQPSAFYWADLLKGNLLLSLAYVNPVVPGLLVLLGLLIALARHEAGEGRGWLAVAVLLAPPFPTSRSSWAPICCWAWPRPHCSRPAPRPRTLGAPWRSSGCPAC